MGEAVAVAYLNRRMAELGYDKYFMRFRHFVLAPSEIRNVEAGGRDVFVLIEPVASVAINSGFGMFDLSQPANEMQYEHNGNITITNYAVATSHVRMVQGIPPNS